MPNFAWHYPPSRRVGNLWLVQLRSLRERQACTTIRGIAQLVNRQKLFSGYLLTALSSSEDWANDLGFAIKKLDNFNLTNSILIGFAFQ
jgi:hypothetical protein